MNSKKIKGGSLSSTSFCTEDDLSFIRKKVSLVENREFGFYRWLSQLKKMQRLGSLFPDIFPNVIDFGVQDDMAYFDTEFIADSVTVAEFLRKNPSKKEVKSVFEKLMQTSDMLHSVKMKSFKGGFKLYLNQEVERALNFCMDGPSFKEFTKYKAIIFNNIEVPSLLYRLPEFYKLADQHFINPEECLTHGNLTLENVLYVPSKQKIVFIDLYEENFIDTTYNEYSQILQSCNSYYEVYNELPAIIQGNEVVLKTEKYPGLDYFNELFANFLHTKFSQDELIVTKLYEVSQFTRMLPFKKCVAKDKMIFFYALASYLFNSLSEYAKKS